MFEYEFNTYEVVTSGLSSLLGLQIFAMLFEAVLHSNQ